MAKKIVAVVGSYRQSGTTDSAVEAILAAAREKGAETAVVYLALQNLEFCNNCRRCTQEPGSERGKCPHQDAMESILTELESADALVLASPVNYWNVTAITRLFLERLLGYAYWPWNAKAPVLRRKHPTRKAVLVSSCAMPLGFMIPLFTGAARALRVMARSLGARPVARLWIGLAGERQPQLSPRQLRHARKIGLRLA